MFWALFLWILQIHKINPPIQTLEIAIILTISVKELEDCAWLVISATRTFAKDENNVVMLFYLTTQDYDDFLFQWLFHIGNLKYSKNTIIIFFWRIVQKKEVLKIFIYFPRKKLKAIKRHSQKKPILIIGLKTKKLSTFLNYCWAATESPFFGTSSPKNVSLAAPSSVLISAALGSIMLLDL